MERRALELNVYPPFPKCPPPSDFDFDFDFDSDDWHYDRTMERKNRIAKQLGDAEIAAEAYRQMLRAVGESGMVGDGADNIAPGDAAVFGPVREETARLGVLKRFAVLDHASVKDYE